MSDDTTPENPAESGSPRYAEIDHEYGMRLATTDPADDGPVWMINLMKYRERADYADGRESGITGREADDRYTPIESLNAIGAEIVYVGDVEDQLLGDSPVWDRIGVVKYPTRRSFIEMQSRSDFQKKHEHKEAGMQQTIVMGGQPIPLPDTAGSADWADVEHPPTDDDGPVTVVHVIRYEDADDAAVTPDHMVEYQTAAGQVAGRHGVRISGWFAVEGTILGDGRQWHQVRFNTFPSKRAFTAVVMDPERLAAQGEHRETAIADTYTMIVRPQRDDLRAST